MSRSALIISAVRSPLGKRHGALKDHHPVILGALILQELFNRAGVAPKDVDDVIWGCVTQAGEQSLNIGRNTWLAAHLPVDVPATTIDRQCGSSQSAINFAAALIESEACDVVVAGGVESMSRVPMGSNAAGPGSPFPPELAAQYDLVSQGISAELMAHKYGVTREEMDHFAVQSHSLAHRATLDLRFKSQILPIQVTDQDGQERMFEVDEGIRANTSYEVLANLSPAFHPHHSITAGNSSQITDGSVAILLMSEKKAKQLGLKARARIVSHVTVGCDPILMLEGPIPATRKVLLKAKLNLSDIDLFEINEAFASVPLAWLKELNVDPQRLNVNGGAIALGHPLGASGARLMVTLLYELERSRKRYGLESMCCGGGLGTATIIERLG